MILNQLKPHLKNNPPEWLFDNTFYVTVMGSVAYGTNLDYSDQDLYGFYIPPKSHLFPHIDGYVHGFDNPKQFIETFQEHHIQVERIEYDISLHSIVKYFKLCMNCNPNMIDSLYTPTDCIYDCIYHGKKISQMVRARRNVFLSQILYEKFEGYADTQRTKMVNQDKINLVKFLSSLSLKTTVPFCTKISEINNELNKRGTTELSDISTKKLTEYKSELIPYLDNLRSKRQNRNATYDELVGSKKRGLDILNYGYDLKFAMNLIRLMRECEQLLRRNDLNLRKDSALLKAIRNGEYTLQNINEQFDILKKSLNHAFLNTTLPKKPQTRLVKELLLNCLEEHYGKLSNLEIINPNKERSLFLEIEEIINKYR